MEDIHVKEQYFGKENPFHLQIRRRAMFLCSFERLRFFPFGPQNCYLKFYLFGGANNMTRIVLEDIVNKGPLDIGRYMIHSWNINIEIDENVVTGVTEKNKVKVTMRLGRDFENSELNFFLNSIDFILEILETLPL